MTVASEPMRSNAARDRRPDLVVVPDDGEENSGISIVVAVLSVGSMRVTDLPLTYTAVLVAVIRLAASDTGNVARISPVTASSRVTVLELLPAIQIEPNADVMKYAKFPTPRTVWTLAGGPVRVLTCSATSGLGAALARNCTMKGSNPPSS